jgi:hypothetical protein
MNGRLKELWEQSKTSGVHPEFGEYDKYSAEKFAELIVRECIAVHKDDYGVDIIGDVLKNHFGIEE